MVMWNCKNVKKVKMKFKIELKIQLLILLISILHFILTFLDIHNSTLPYCETQSFTISIKFPFEAGRQQVLSTQSYFQMVL